MASIQPITLLTAATVNTVPGKVSRSLSVSSASSGSSAYSRAADDMLDRLAAQAPHNTFHLWSAGNVRLNGLDLTLPSVDAADLYQIIQSDERFEIVDVVYLDHEDGEDWKLSIRRTTFQSPPITPMVLDA